jgi:Mn2+/Fe2+ NRAMP family transporter
MHLAWDANRPIPWRRLLREAGIFIVIGALAIIFLVDHPKPGTFLGLVLGMIFYVLFVAVLSKFGYQRQSMREAREKRNAVAAAPAAAASAARQRPAPTRRTSTGPSQRPNRSTKKRRR